MSADASGSIPDLPAPAEQPETPDFIREGGMAPASSYRAREFTPYPKGGKR